jgi:hypothetical protein
MMMPVDLLESLCATYQISRVQLMLFLTLLLLLLNILCLIQLEFGLVGELGAG